MASSDVIAELLQKLLLGQNELQRQAVEQKERDERLTAELQRQASLLATLTSRGLVSLATPSQLGHQSMETLNALDAVRNLEPGEGPAILTFQQQAELSSLAEGYDAEAAIVRYMTPHLSALRQRVSGDSDADSADPTPLILVNSEAHVWLVHPAVEGVANQRLKPDLFLTWAPFVDVRVEDKIQRCWHGLSFCIPLSQFTHPCKRL